MTDAEKGQRLLTAVERLVSNNTTLRTKVAEAKARATEKASELTKKPDSLREATAVELIRTFSNNAAIAGGASAAPALIPGIGSIAVGVAGGIAELAYLLKTEVELALCLLHLYGFDIEEPKERQIGFLLASVGTSMASGSNVVGDLIKAEGVALWNYAPRHIARFVIRAMTAIAMGWVSRSLLRMVPLIGIGVAATMNKVLTQRVGDRVMRDLRTRRDMIDGDDLPRVKAKAKAKPKSKAGARPTRRAKLKVVE